MILGGKDKFVDNAASREFYSKSATPSSKKSIKQFFNGYHQVHQEEETRGDYYNSIYQFVAKQLADQGYTSNKDVANWGGLKAFEVGRPKNQVNPPVKRFLFLVAVVLYLLKGLLMFILIKLFSRRKAQYKLLNVLLKWPKAYFHMFSVLRKLK
mmetsp:Transcript_32368/g.49528  ORF Transcript_32368/g.49528 Transcript_32368/m.49528 type:complete len:154 (-) Transcript_32368:18-479(-)